METIKRTGVQFDAEDLHHFEVMREVIGKTIPTPMSDQQLVRILMRLGYEQFARLHNLQPQLPFSEPPKTKS